MKEEIGLGTLLGSVLGGMAERLASLERAAEMRRERIERLAESINNLRLALDEMQLTLAKIEAAIGSRDA